jgi:hypothetical protein
MSQRDLPANVIRRRKLEDINYVSQLFQSLDSELRASVISEVSNHVAALGAAVRSIEVCEWKTRVASSGNDERDPTVFHFLRLNSMMTHPPDNLSALLALLELAADIQQVDLFPTIVAVKAEAAVDDNEEHDSNIRILESALNQSFPIYSDLGRLCTTVNDINFSARSEILSESISYVACRSDKDYSAAEDLLRGFEYFRATSDLYCADASTILGININENDFEVFEEAIGWRIDKDALRSEVRHQCIISIAGDIALWRHNFVRRVLSDF